MGQAKMSHVKFYETIKNLLFNMPTNFFISLAYALDSFISQNLAFEKSRCAIDVTHATLN